MHIQATNTLQPTDLNLQIGDSLLKLPLFGLNDLQGHKVCQKWSKAKRPLRGAIAESSSARDKLLLLTFSLYWLRARCSPAIAQFCSVATASSLLSMLGDLADTICVAERFAKAVGTFER